MNEVKAQLIGFGFAMIPYMAVAWGYSYLTEGGQPIFWRALGVLLAVRLFFAIIESIGSFLAWRFFVRRQMIAHLVGVFRANEFPAKQYSDDDFGNYCARLLVDQPRKPSYMQHAQDIQTFLLIHEKRGILDGLRMHTVVDTAFQQYMATVPKTELVD
jgi:hypothetical protein